MKILVTGTAGFIGFSLARQLLNDNHEVVGIDNINDYYDVNLKYARLYQCGIDATDIAWHKAVRSSSYENYRFIRLNLEDKTELMNIFKLEKFDVIVHLAAQAGVRNSISNPEVYIQSNIVGFLNILEACRHHSISHLVYASSSSVYGLNEQMPFSTSQGANHPVSLYAATKKSNELMAHVYSHLFKLPTTGLRFFTVYGPWGRPDMGYYLFADAILKNEPIKVFNQGMMKRDFTYIDDIVDGIVHVMEYPPESANDWNPLQPNPSISSAPYKIYNIGNDQPVNLLDFIYEIEKNCGVKARLELIDMQLGDVPATWADVNDLVKNFDYKPHTSIQVGLRKFSSWFKNYHRSLHVKMAG